MRYTPTGKLLLIAAPLFMLGVDLWSLTGRCDLSPAVSRGGVTAALLLEVVAFLLFSQALQYHARTAQPPGVSRFQGKLLVVAVCLLLFSSAMFRQAVLFGDTFSNARGVVSQGERCFAPRP